MAKLTAKQERFCKEYLIDFNATAACVRAGYSKKTAYSIANQNMAREDIRKRIAELVKEKEDELICSATESLRYVSSVIRGETREEVFRITADGEQVHDILKTPTRDRLKAAEIMLKVNGLFDKNINVSGDLGVQIEVDYGDES